MLALAACGRHEERELTGWLKVDIVRPVGSGRRSSYLVLHDTNKQDYEPGTDPAVLVDLGDGKGLRIVRETDQTLRPLNE